jgi:hypothetical protein
VSTAGANSVRRISRTIVERDCHVSATVRAAAYHVMTRLRDGRATYRRMSRDERRALWIGAREGVRSNWALYTMAMRATPTARKPRV